MAQHPEFTKYLPLGERFHNQPVTKNHIELTFDQRAPLPTSATKLITGWTNVSPKIQGHRTAWLNNGWRVEEFDLQARRVKFVRDRI